MITRRRRPTENAWKPTPVATPATEERGSVTAELAIALPVVILTLLLGVGAFSAGARHVLLQDAVSGAARLLGRGETIATAQQAVTRNVGTATLTVEHADGLVCVTGRLNVTVGHFITVPLDARGCALDEGR